MSVEHQRGTLATVVLLARSARRLFIPAIVTYTVIAVLVSLTNRADFVVYILVASVIGLFMFSLGGLISRWHFGRLLRVLDPIRAEAVGLGGKVSLDASGLMIKATSFYTFLLQRDFLELEDVTLRRSGLLMFAFYVLVMICAWLSLGSYFVLFSVAHAFLPM